MWYLLVRMTGLLRNVFFRIAHPCPVYKKVAKNDHPEHVGVVESGR
jgi:hypothetical protein